MDGFSGYKQIQIKTKDQHKPYFICPWGTFMYKKIPCGLKNVGATFQRKMNFSFHDIKAIFEPYLDYLPAHSPKIRTNPHKCVFCVESGRLLGFIVSNKGIQVDPLKVEAIVNLPPPRSIRQLQSL